MFQQFKCNLGETEIIIETGKMAKQAGGSVTVRSGDSIVLVAATAAPTPKNEADFLPLSVEYVEKTYAAGKIPGGFFKREGKPSETSVLTSRFIDRPIRPLFPENYYYETQVIATVLSACPKNPPEVLAMIGASAALVISDIPFKKPIAGCQVCRVDGQFKINPTLADIERADLSLVVAASEDAVVMVEGEALEAKEADLVAAIEFAHRAMQPVIQLQKEMQKKCGKPKREMIAPQRDEKITKAVQSVKEKVVKALAIKVKQDRYAQLSLIKDELKDQLIDDNSTFDHKLQLATDFENLKSDLMRHAILKDKKRIDGRTLEEIRPITCEVGLLPRAHGSALFTRGETQALVVATLGASDEAQRIDGLLQNEFKRFMLNYNFPSFSVGEVKPLRSPGRREIGHGFLAERSLVNQLPEDEKFPYAIRVVSEILESNGSSSMATVCGGSLALMDAGVPIKNPVAGIAMGLIMENKDYAILSDILGDEDHLGDMDFKVTGTTNGVSAVQMDIKIEGITSEIMASALEQARTGRLFILDKMHATIAEARPEVAEHAPRMTELWIRPERIKDVIGPGGKHIKGIVEETGVKVDVEDDGRVRIFSSDAEAAKYAVELVRNYAGDVEIGKEFSGIVKKITTFGAFVELVPTKSEGLVHISEIANFRIREVTDIFREGDTVNVKVIAVDDAGKIKLSMKGLEQSERIKEKLQRR